MKAITSEDFEQAARYAACLRQSGRGQNRRLTTQRIAASRLLLLGEHGGTQVSHVLYGKPVIVFGPCLMVVARLWPRHEGD